LVLVSIISYTTNGQRLISEVAEQTANYAVTQYSKAMESSLAELVTFNTVAKEGVNSPDNPIHIAFKQALKKQALELGFDFVDHGYIVVIGYGEHKERLGIITHGDIQPVDATKWQKSPFLLDKTSEPGKLIARGTEDDKGAISTALYAMKAIKDRNIALNKRIELYVYMAEESDWGPLEAFVANHELPQVNITIDAEYPVVTAEKGWGLLKYQFEKSHIEKKIPYIDTFIGGYFASQIPEDAKATLYNVSPNLVKQLKKNAPSFSPATFSFEQKGNVLHVFARGVSAHSSKPQEGVNAIPYLAALLNSVQSPWPNNGAGSMVNFINDNIGLDVNGVHFGDIAYSDDFMGPMTVSPTVIVDEKQYTQLHINLRRPKGKDKAVLIKQINDAVSRWQLQTNAKIQALPPYIGEPFVQDNAPQTETLLHVFSHYTGIKNAKPIAIGGGTNSRLFPNAVSFGPSMPNKAYTGHTEHEFITVEQFKLNLKMYTAAFIELAL